MQTVGDEPVGGAGRIPALDGLRGLAILLVLLSHSSNVQIFLVPGLDFRGYGRAGVFLFFVLSSFLLTGQFLDRDPGQLAHWRPWVRYLARRLLRIYPAYVACLFLYLGLRDWIGITDLRSWTLSTVGEHLAMVRAQFHFWSVPVEMGFYLVLPLVVVPIAALGRRPVPTVVCLVLAAVALRMVQPPAFGSGAPDWGVRVLPFVPVFLAGSAVAVLHRAWLGLAAERRARLSRRFDLLAALSVVGLALHSPAVWSLVVGEYVNPRRFHLAFDRFGVLWALLLLALLCGSGGLRRPFEWRPLRFVGAVSYSTYLLHRAVLVKLEVPLRAWPRPLPLLGFLTASLVAGWISWRLLERPFARVWARSAPGVSPPPAVARGDPHR